MTEQSTQGSYGQDHGESREDLLTRFFNGPQALLDGQEWLTKHGLKRGHTSTLCNIYARWRKEPNKPISLSDCERLYGISRKTAAKLLSIIACEAGYEVERVKRHNGADRGYILRRRSDKNKRPDEGCDANRSGSDAATRRVAPSTQRSETYNSPTRTFYKNQDQDIQSKADIGGPAGPLVMRLQWTENEELMLCTAIEIYQERQDDFYGDNYHIDANDRLDLLDAAKRHHKRYLDGDTEESLEYRLANALNRAEAHSWSYERAHPHSTSSHFGAHLRRDSLPPLVSTDDVNDHSEAEASESRHPKVRWCASSHQWLAAGSKYLGETFPEGVISPFL